MVTPAHLSPSARLARAHELEFGCGRTFLASVILSREPLGPLPGAPILDACLAKTNDNAADALRLVTGALDLKLCEDRSNTSWQID